MAKVNYFFYPFAIMNKLLISLLLLFPLAIAAQSDTVTDAHGHLLYLYNRTSTVNPDNESELLVTFSFTNGHDHQAISFRQEAMDGLVRWINTDGGEPGKEKVVDFVTANLSPNQTVTWTYAVTPRSGTKLPKLEKAAILLMHEDYGVEKIWLK